MTSQSWEELDASSTAIGSAWFALLQDVNPSGSVRNVTAGHLREVNERQSRIGAGHCGSHFYRVKSNDELNSG